MKSDVEAAITELRACYPDRVEVTELPDGGAKVVVKGLSLKESPYAESDTWFGFTITFLHPYADIYPHFIRPDLTRKDKSSLGPNIQLGNNFYGEPAAMLSRRTKLCGPEHPTNAVLKLQKVHQWLISQ
jgi:hypothetical protein